MIKINFRLQNYDEMMLRYKQLLTYIKSAVTRNHSEKSINSILVNKKLLTDNSVLETQTIGTFTFEQSIANSLLKSKFPSEYFHADRTIRP